MLRVFARFLLMLQLAVASATQLKAEEQKLITVNVTFSIDVAEQNGYAFSSLYFGDPKQERNSSSFILSTFDSMLYVTSTDCPEDQCGTAYYNSTASTSASCDTTERMVERILQDSNDNFQTVNFTVVSCTDNLCAGDFDQSDLCTTGATFDKVVNASSSVGSDWNDQGQYDGQLGLGPTKISGEPPYFLQRLKDDQGLHTQVSFWMNAGETTSMLTFGGMREDSISGPIYEQSYQQVGDVWALQLTDVMAGNIPIKSSPGYAAPHPQSKSIVLDVETYDNWFAQTTLTDLDLSSCVYETCIVKESCDAVWTTLPSISFTLDKVIFKIPPEGYTQSVEENQCEVQITKYRSVKGQAQVIPLGLAFMRNFVITYSYSDKMMKLALNPNAPNGTSIEPVVTPPTPPTPPTPDDPSAPESDGDGKLLYMSIAAIILVVFLCGFICLCKVMCAKKQEQDQAAEIAYTQIEETMQTQTREEAAKSNFSSATMKDMLVAVEEDKPKVLSVRKPKSQKTIDDFD